MIPTIQRGDIVRLGRHSLLCGDATDPADLTRLLGDRRVDMLFTDPPYGVNYEGGHFHSGDVNIRRKRERLAGDGDTGLYARFLPVVLPHVDGPCYVWFASTLAGQVYDALAANHCQVSAMIVWHKTNATYAAMGAQYKQRHETCVYFKPRGSTLRWSGPTNERTVWEMKRDGRNIWHPTQKPFAGSGSTILAAEQLDRTVYAIEIEPAYCAKIVERWEIETGRPAEIERAA